MKTFKHFLYFVILLFVLVCMACHRNVDNEEENNNTDDDTCDFIITDGKVQSPQWLIRVIDSLKNYLIEPQVYSIKHDEQEYILLREDRQVNTTIKYRNYLIFNCSGTKIDPTPELWNELTEDALPCDIVKIDNRVKRPDWLALIVDSISDIYTPEYDYIPSTFTVKHHEQDYILIRNTFSSSIPLGYIFVSCSGEKVVPESVLWGELMDEILPCDIKFADDRIQSPQWLVQAIDSVANLYWPRGALKPFVYSLQYKEQDYIFLRDGAASTRSRGYIFFTCFGEKVVPESDLWNELVDEYKKNYNVLLLIWLLI